MKKVLGIISIFLLVFSMCAGISVNASSSAYTLYVSVFGNDENSGSEAQPLATLDGARKKVREIRNENPSLKGSVTVIFREGTYNWTDSVNFTAEDSGTPDSKTIYAAYPDEKVIFQGGAKISGSEFQRASDSRIREDISENVYSFDLGNYMTSLGYELSDCYPLNEDIYSFSYKKSRPIFSFDGEGALWIARYPNKSGGEYPDVNPNTKFLTADITSYGGITAPSTFSYANASNKTADIERISRYAGRDDVWFFGFPVWSYFHFDVRLSEINAENKTFTTAKPLDIYDERMNGELGMGKNFIIYNILEELDAEGEYYIDKNSGIFYVYTEKNIKNKSLNVSFFNGDYMIKTKNTSYVTLSGITFENSNGSGLVIDGGRDFRTEYCKFYNMGINAVVIGVPTSGIYSDFGDFSVWQFELTFCEFYSKYKGITIKQAQTELKDITQARKTEIQHLFWSQGEFAVENTGYHNGLYSCVIKNTGQTAVSIYGGSAHRNERADHYVENCDISFAGVNKRSYSGAINLDRMCGVSIKNNTLRHCPGAIINGNTTVADIEYNDIYDGMSEGFDNGIIYFNYNYPALDVKINNNYFHDVPLEPNIYVARGDQSQRAGIAFDHMYGGGKEFKNNYFANLPKGTFVYNNCPLENNVFVECYKPVQGVYPSNDNYYPFAEGKTMADIDNMANMPYGPTLSGLPIFINDEIYNTWKELYPSFMNWVEVINSQSHEGKKFFEIKNNLIMNDKNLLQCKTGGESEVIGMNTDKYYTGAMYNEVSNNSYTQRTEIFSDYNNKNYTLTKEAKTNYGINPLDLKKVGAKITNAPNYLNVGASAIQYQPTKIVNVAGKAPEKVSDKYVTLLLTKDGNIVYAAQSELGENRTYSFTFETDEDLSMCELTLRAGTVAFKEEIIVTSDKSEAVKPKLTLKIGNTVRLTMTLDNSFNIPDYDYTEFLAIYDKSGKLIGLNASVPKTANQTGITDDVITFELTAEQLKNAFELRGYMWDKTLKPLCKSEIKAFSES